MFSNHVLYDTIEVNICDMKKEMNMIDYADKVIIGVPKKPAERASILYVLNVELIYGNGLKTKVEWMNKIVVANGYIELDLRNERADNDSHILFYKDSKLRFLILRTKENLFKIVSGKATASEAGSGSIPIKITATDAVQQFKISLDNK
jgi:hypothetical protein